MNYENTLREIVSSATAWSDVKNGLENFNTSESKEKQKDSRAGVLFENFAKYYFLVEPTVKDEYKNVWLFKEIPEKIREQLNFTYQDYGVDLILQGHDNEITAVQCKFKNDESAKLSWSKDKLANLFGYCPTADNYIIFTNVSDIDHITKSRFNNFSLYSIHNLLELSENTMKNIYRLSKNEAIKESKKFTPKEHQKEAINKATEYFKLNNKGQLILPCGAGKTLTSLWIKEKIKSTSTLVLLPSLSLLRQFKNSWQIQRKDDYKYLCVCSDKDVDSNENDSTILHTYEIDAKVTTEPEAIGKFIATNNNHVIFCTYQSLKKVEESIKESKHIFNLAVCDEAHKTAGLKTNAFSLIHNENKIFIEKRLYMTATPKIASTKIKEELDNDDIDLYDMSNEKVFGKEIFRMNFKDAIDKEILVDYKIVIVGVNNKEIKTYINERRYISNKYSIDEIANNYALEKVMSEYGAHHSISFHSRVRYADEFIKRHSILYPDTFSEYVSGKHGAGERSRILSSFDKNKKGVIANARCLTEGIDVPAIDLVYFCDPKNSKIDIVQAAGRALRIDLKRNKQMGYIVIPVYHNLHEDIEESIEKNVFNNVIQVVRSMADHDERLKAEINNIAFNKSKRHNSKINILFESSDPIFILENFEEQLEKSLFNQIILKSLESWEQYYLELQNYVGQNNGNVNNVEDEKLNRWCSRQRLLFKKCVLSSYRQEKLTSLGFEWDLQALAWEQKFSQLEQYRQEDDYEPSQSKNEDLYSWLRVQNRVIKNDKLSEVRKERLKSLNFVGNQQDKNWENNFLMLVGFLDKNNGKYPRQKSKEEVERSLAVWVLTVRKDYKNSKLTDERIKKIESINFSIDADGDKWDKNFEAVKKYFLKHDEYPFQRKNTLGAWCFYQADKLSNKDLNKRQVEQLNSINFEESFIKVLAKTDGEKWDEIFCKVKDYFKKNKKSPVRHKDNTKHINYLANWCGRQRENFKKSTLSEKQIDNLKSIDFIFDGEKRKSNQWNKMFEQLIEFRRLHPNRWPKIKSPEENKLSVWCSYNRNWYNNNLPGQFSDFPMERVNILKTIGFNFKGSREVLSWEENYNNLISFIKKNGKLTSRHEKKTNKNYVWYYHQKKRLRENKMLKDEIAKMKKLDKDYEEFLPGKT